ncbi:VWA domain-containing protein [Thiobaca trueperi]|uniref:Uncharacterized protein (TIGR03503 family) n=1 Tax=Thiobaca trueperi TaxID=127458 RepID=A0A4R3N1L3_9GAMM|nr:vWA domain-containing protein [Thiobaca trueperi]TCT21971.1 uncharacterized protein (TIGR03503 family) [Thiobaca trueperi]
MTIRPCFDPLRPSLFALLLLGLLAAAGPLFAATPDVRILIDVSGSMRQTDPQNLRVPALRLVNELLPAGAEAGIWLFAEKVEVLAPPGRIDDKWKTRTRARLDRIHSRGLFTDIEQAINAATAGWDKPDETRERHLIVLTDGLVDVAKEADKSVASRARILGEQLERLKAAKIKVHGIALSDQVDTQLMRLLAKETGGWMESAKDADELQRVFLRMLEQTAAPTTVPLEGNRFEIDDQVSEFTLLAFREEGQTEPTKLVAPGGETISATRLPEGGVWRAEAGYDLVTLPNPKPGRWRLKGISDPDNRVAVVTDMGVGLGPLPNSLRAGDTLRIETWLTDHQQPLTRRDLLELLTAKAGLTDIAAGEPAPAAGQTEVVNKTPEQAPASENGAAATPAPPGAATQPSDLPLTLAPDSERYMGDLETQTLAPGIYQLQVTIDGGTFKRQTMKRFKIAGPPVTIRYDQEPPTDTAPTASLILTLGTEPDLIDPKTLFGYLLVEGPEGYKTVVDLPAMTDTPPVLRLPVAKPGEYRIKGRMTARTLTGESIGFEPAPGQVIFDFVVPHAEPEPEPASTGLSWITLGLYLLGGNAILALLLGPTWWLLKRPATK